METLFAAAAGSFMIMLLVALTIAIRRGMRIQELQSDILEQKRKVGESEERYKSKCRQNDETLTRLTQAKDEIAKAKRKAYLLEQKEKQPEARPEPEPDKKALQALEESRDESRRYRQEISDLQKEREQWQDQLGRVKKELQETKSRIQSQQQVHDSQNKNALDQLKALEEQNAALDKKLQSAKRKARIDSQVYKVTNNKLELALAKIAYLEKQVNAHEDVKPEDTAAANHTKPDDHQTLANDIHD